MSEPFIGEIRMFGGNFAPRGWAYCNGQLLQISSNQALFSIFGTIYGGDGRTTFGLPDLRGRAPIGAGQGAGLSNRVLGSAGGAESASLTSATNPAHTHTPTARAHSTGTDSTTPTGGSLAVSPAYSTGGPNASMSPSSVALASTGGGQAHNNMQPFGVVNYIVALLGIFPSRN